MNSVSGRRLTLAEVDRGCHAVLEGFGFSAALSSALTGRIRRAEHFGIASHGLAMLARYRECALSGRVNLAPVPKAFSPRPGFMVVDCENSFAALGFEQVQADFAARTRAQGVACLVTQNAYHLSALGLDILPLAEKGLMAIAMTGTAPWIVPHGGDRPILGTNPVAFACPRRDQEPLLWDQASSVISISDVQVAQRQGRTTNMKAGLDRQGMPTDDPGEILASRKLLPFGGHKGSAIALMVELLTAGLSGGRFAVDYDKSRNGPANSAGQFYLAIDPSAVSGNFTAHIETVLDAFAGNGVARIPGDGRFARQSQAQTDGVPVSDDLWARLVEWGWPEAGRVCDGAPLPPGQ
ncbi:Ldh family oxidoreductase [Aquamicrobium soli]|jgi:delta1-piperideine-2-carboxylate reductase|uniref:Ldh family oxidoreductase n=1 Tax=Aquamicrobium soli TaxID=1811518 RepID=A0ABV7K7F3_9HYPH